MNHDAHELYRQRRDAAQRDAARWAVQERWLSHARLAVFAAAAICGFLAFGAHRISPWWIGPSALMFVALVVAHDRVIGRKTRSERREAHFELGLARLEDRWAGLGVTGNEYPEPDHLYAADLDLFGKGSLFELLCAARTPAGERILASWLTAPAPASEVCARQAAVAELQPRVDLREDIALLGDDVRSRLDPRALLRWGNAAPAAPSRALRALAMLLTLATVSSISAWLIFDARPIFTVIALGIQSGFAWTQRGRLAAVLKGASGATRDLRLLGALLERLEREEVEAPRLVALRERFEIHGRPPSARIAELQRYVDLLDGRRNQLFAPFAAVLLWGTHCALLIDTWRAECGRHLGDWIEASGEMEALAALSGYAFEHPDDVFPEIVETRASVAKSEEGALFDGCGLGHPLLPGSSSVRNDLRLDRETQALIVSGSNMSGKSTLLRTVGVNTVLALAGAPVRATSLRLTPLAVGASIRVNDSLQQGTSRFYAEITRLRQVVQLCDGDLPVLFLLDEILHGTNSHDRRIGAEALVRSLLSRRTLGLVTTHDLALARIADELAPRIQNVHFQDHLEDGKMVFDYQLQGGVVTKSNALALMRAVGLELPEA